jgi:hypothetical protein
MVSQTNGYVDVSEADVIKAYAALFIYNDWIAKENKKEARRVKRSESK